METNRTLHHTITAIVNEMQRQGVSQTELARRLGWGRMQVNRRLTGDAELAVSELEQIARALEVSPITFLAATGGAK